ncbi:MAG: SsrA-binding protein SmpB [Actinobacteria bacterium]|nr:SsrA-binding protein SmpB [Actinomycetota bacterium]
MAKASTATLASNRKARHDYAILDVVEAGIVLHGSEVKSLRAGQVQIADAFARVIDGEVWLDGVHIPPYQYAVGVGSHDPDRPRKLLLHRDEIERLADRVARERLSLVPLALRLVDGRVKVDLALARGRRREDKRRVIAERDVKREMQRALGRQRKGMN